MNLFLYKMLFVGQVIVSANLIGVFQPNFRPVSVIMIMGASCSGKSSVAEKLKKELNDELQKWEIVDFDEVGESLDRLVEQVNKCLESNTNVIVDTNTYEKNIEVRFSSAFNVTKVVLEVPLKTLLERDARRTKNLARSEERAFWAREFVKNSCEDSKRWPRDLTLLMNNKSIEDCCREILSFIHNLQRQ